jgi:hypothetical protein
MRDEIRRRWGSKDADEDALTISRLRLKDAKQVIEAADAQLAKLHWLHPHDPGVDAEPPDSPLSRMRRCK